MGWSLRKKKEGTFCAVYFVRRKLFQNLCFISMYSVLNTLSEYTYFYISKNITSYTFLLVLKVIESLQCILNTSLLFLLINLVYEIKITNLFKYNAFKHITFMKKLAIQNLSCNLFLSTCQICPEEPVAALTGFLKILTRGYYFQ